MVIPARKTSFSMDVHKKDQEIPNHDSSLSSWKKSTMPISMKTVALQSRRAKKGQLESQHGNSLKLTMYTH